MSKNKDGTMPVLEHLAELRLRLLISAGALLVAAIISFANIEAIRSILTYPLEGLMLIFLSPPEAFMANLRLAIISGFVVSSPVIVYEIAAFIFPGLTRGEKIFFVLIIFGIIILFAGGVIFAYIVVFPFTLRFFLQFASAELEPRFTISEYITFLISFHIAFGVAFQLPLFTWALGKIGLLSTEFLRRHRKVALLIMLILSAVITPPDIISQVVMVLPLALLYEVGIIMVLISERKRRKELAQY
ncbi:MAG: twin-arginine translocase subunit TatC [Bacillota bacterium]|nr:twin-arginine translocase subunit TatC [Bacillota bacterium]MDW7729549.1 twin-arginine translocase subunit TatC [Bacillota bacterium]